jgi:site-specific recombinase XerD
MTKKSNRLKRQHAKQSAAVAAGSAALLRCVQGYFSNYLGAQRGLSANTISAYRDAIKLLLTNIGGQVRRPVADLTLNDLNADAVIRFLSSLETSRGNTIRTRNTRLSAIRTFFRYLISQDPTRAAQYHAAAAIPLKRASRPTMAYLDASEMRAVLDGIDRRTRSGRRDYVLLLFLYNTGARVQEAVTVRTDSLRLDVAPTVTITGKRQKTRHTPLWKETAQVLRTHIAENGITNDKNAPLFANRRGIPLTRFGVAYIVRKRVEAAAARCPSLTRKRVSPHTLRHTTAMHLLQAGVELAVIKAWLGHAYITTTHEYAEADLEMKRKAISAIAPTGGSADLQRTLRHHKDVLTWLESL